MSTEQPYGMARWSRSRPSSESDLRGSWVRRFGLIIAVTLASIVSPFARAGSVTYIYTDQQGTTLVEADTGGNVTANYDYRPYGSTYTGSGLSAAPDGPGYTGHVQDSDTAFVYMQARYYDPALGRFLSIDPAPPKPGDPFSFNRHAYAENNPIMRIDPDGRTVTCDASSCAIDSHSVVEAAVDHTIVSVIYVKRLIDNARAGNRQQSQDHTPTQDHPGSKESAPEAAPALPTGLIGDSPRETGKNGGTAVGTSLPSDKFADAVEQLTGGSLGKPDSKGRSTSPNGVSVRTGGSEGPRIDVPANGTKPPEIVHFPKDTPVPENLKPTP